MSVEILSILEELKKLKNQKSKEEDRPYIKEEVYAPTHDDEKGNKKEKNDWDPVVDFEIKL